MEKIILSTTLPAIEGDLIPGISVITLGELSNGLQVDADTLQMLVNLGANGVRSHLNHTSELEYMLGTCENMRIEGDRVRCDLRLSPAAALSPAGNLLAFLAALVEHNAGVIGMSIVADIQRKGKAIRPQALYAIDLVDFPAANVGLFSAMSVKEMEVTVMEEQKEEVNQSVNWAEAAAAAATDTMIAGSGLPAPVADRLRAGKYSKPEEVTGAIAAARQELAALSEAGVINMPGKTVSVGMGGFEELQLALEALIAGEAPKAGVRPLTGIREAYLLLSGDYEMRGIFSPERVQFGTVNSSTMAGMVANAMNKRVISLFQAYPQWWLPAVTIENFTSLQQVKWVTLGGIGELPTVTEGSAYSEMTWDDQTETATFIKKGGYVGITMEAMDKDDTRRLQLAPRALAQAAWMTLGKAIAAIFTVATGTGPTMSDSVVLFHANHSNLGTTALSFASYSATRTAMMKQTELNSGERLGALTAPYLLWVPVDLLTTAQQILGSFHDPSEGSTTSKEALNPFGEGETAAQRLKNANARTIVCPFWTDTNNWAAQANPALYPSIGLGFRYGQTPEVFSVASPTGGLMFTNDTLPVKVRYFYAVGPTDWRGLYKHNVA